MRPFNPRFADRPTTIFTVMSTLAAEHGAINLGQGAPDEDGPEAIRRVAADATIEGPNQYPPMAGLPELRKAVADANRRFYGIEVDWARETLITVGATEALAASLLALLSPGDEAILIEPFYDAYAAMIEGAGAVVRTVSLTPPHWRLDAAALEAAVTEKTKLIVVNTPHNPTGAVFTEDEVAAVARVAARNDLYVVSDEVYEHLIFDGRPHLSPFARPELRDRCVRIGSAGKAFSMTGWKVGYLTGPEAMVSAISKAHQFLTFTVAPNLQKAVAYGLSLPDSFFTDYRTEMEGKRDRLAAGLAGAGFGTARGEGTYFLTVDLEDVGWKGDDVSFCREITEKAGVAAVPISAFYQAGAPHAPRRYARFCYCKKPDALDEAARRLRAYFG